MPHMAALQEEYADQGVTMISVTDEKLATVQRFLQRKVRSRRSENDEESDGNNAKKTTTYHELTSAYHLACDPDGSVFKDYMEAADQNGIPAAFLIGKTGKVEWVGHPMVIDQPLEAVLNDNWDRAKFAKEFDQSQQASRLLSVIRGHMETASTKRAVEAIDKFLESDPPVDVRREFRMIKLRVLSNDPRFYEETSKFAMEWLGNQFDDPSDANEVTWAIYELAETGDFENQDVLEAALKVTQAAADKADADSKCFIMDTAAHLQHFLGDHKVALKTQTDAYEMADDEQKEQLVEFYEELKQLGVTTGAANASEKP